MKTDHGPAIITAAFVGDIRYLTRFNFVCSVTNVVSVMEIAMKLVLEILIRIATLLSGDRLLSSIFAKFDGTG